EVEGTLTDQVPTVNEVRLRFGGHGQPSPVTISLADIHYREGAFQAHNEMVARVSTLTFRRKAGPTKMDVTVASVKRKDAGNGFFANLIGDVKGAAANMLIPPVAVEPIGHAAMLDFGRALAGETPEFTFPRAKNLKSMP
ncbi:MAG TPA: hypothetical protein VNZ22_17145, partial [Bacillota bacterium]|nr:hypothetical protein [Bacillota bacterium]